jgi:chromosomal replication initiator protein
MNLWDKILSTLQQKVNAHSYSTWLKPTQQASLADGTLSVEVPSALFAEWINKNYLPLIEECAKELDAAPLQVHFHCRQPGTPRSGGGGTATSAAANPMTAGSGSAGSAAPPKPSGRRRQAAHPDPPAAPSPHHGAASLRGGVRAPGLSARYRFDTFVVSSCNQFAHAASLAVAEQPSGAYNPLFIYGGVGLGKTHLMQAVGNRIAKESPGLTQLYTTTETFMNELINSIRFEKTLDFKQRYRNVDVLLIDDIQFLAGKERTQEEFFHTFNALYEAQKQIVVTSDCPPRDIPTLEERLRSRFEWGLIADIQPPDLETKVAILTKKAEAENVRLPEDVALFISSRIRSNIRELEGSLIRLIAFASINSRQIDIDMARETLRDLIEDRGPGVSPEAIQKFVAGYYNIKTTDLKARNNSRHIAFPRQVAMYLCKHLTTMSLPAIGHQFGGKHHTTVLHAVRKIESMRRQDSDFEKVIDSFMESFR